MTISARKPLTRSLIETFKVFVPKRRRPHLLYALRSMLRRAGLAVHEYSWICDSDARRSAMVAHHRISVAIDVGANIGNYGYHLRFGGFKGKIFSFEPGKSAFDALSRRARNDPNWKVFHVAVGAEEGQVSLNIALENDSSSILPVSPMFSGTFPQVRYVSHELVRMSTLDSLLATELGPNDRALLKIDVQGYEDQVIRGASFLLDKVFLIECELELVPLYEGQLLFGQMVDLLGKQGFALVGLAPFVFDPATGHCWSLDGTFARCP